MMSAKPVPAGEGGDYGALETFEDRRLVRWGFSCWRILATNQLNRAKPSLPEALQLRRAFFDLPCFR